MTKAGDDDDDDDGKTNAVAAFCPPARTSHIDKLVAKVEIIIVVYSTVVVSLVMILNLDRLGLLSLSRCRQGVRVYVRKFFVVVDRPIVCDGMDS